MENISLAENEIKQIKIDSGDELENNFDHSLSLRQQVENLNFQLQNLRKKYIKNQDHSDQELEHYFDLLEINNSKDLIKESDSQKNKLIVRVKSEVARRSVLMKKLIFNIQEIRDQLKFDPIECVNSLSDETFRKLESELFSLKKIQSRNKSKINKIISEIRTLENDMEIDEVFPIDEDPNDLSYSRIKKLSKRLNGLKSADTISQSIDHFKLELHQLWSELRIEIPLKEYVPEYYSDLCNLETLYSLKDKMRKLEQIKMKILNLTKKKKKTLQNIEILNNDDGGEFINIVKKGVLVTKQKEKVRKILNDKFESINNQIKTTLEDIK